MKTIATIIALCAIALTIPARTPAASQFTTYLVTFNFVDGNTGKALGDQASIGASSGYDAEDDSTISYGPPLADGKQAWYGWKVKVHPVAIGNSDSLALQVDGLIVYPSAGVDPTTGGATASETITSDQTVYLGKPTLVSAKGQRVQLWVTVQRQGQG